MKRIGYHLSEGIKEVLRSHGLLGKFAERG